MSAFSAPKFTTGDTLRFYPRGMNNHFTAVVLKDGSVMGVPDRQVHKDIHAWGSTLPHWYFKDVLVNQYGKNPAPYSNLFVPAVPMAIVVPPPSPVPTVAAMPAAPIKKRAEVARYVYPYKTLLRYYPDDSDKHYTALILGKDYVMQVKPEKEEFNSVDEWLAFVSDELELEEIYEEDLTVEMPDQAEYPHTKLDIPMSKVEPVATTAMDEETTLVKIFDGMRIQITGPSKKVKRSLDAIFQAMQI